MLTNEYQMMKNFHSFTSVNNIKVLQFGDESINSELEEGDSWMVFSKEIISKFIKIVLNKNNSNLLVVDKTNCLIGLLRKVCKWNYSSLISEYRLYAGKNSTYFSETFLELATVQLKTHSNNIQVLTSQNTNTSRHGSIDRGTYAADMENNENENENDFDEDDDLLSRSPQVPMNLIKMVEQRKKKNNQPVMESLNTLEYKFYLPEIVFKDVDVIQIELPQESYLPEWFVTQRQCWEEEYLELNLGNY
ncbi:hypothetical protein WICPIJ_000760 [Wickerhamomyces pijperi]|uniref:Uncharacterized protein n=1 Tax=Wickerhamomyces pijperi TaxID=599730 RepID=A0A9P8QFS3_WICPI|nr:hypothetical protein WICPIJ_000760 [Wickerhamomyces pijperi]